MIAIDRYIFQCGKRGIALFLQGILLVVLCCFAGIAYGQTLSQRNQFHCEQCGKLIVTNRTYIISGDLKFCSTDCFNAYADARKPTCSVCGKKFTKGFICDGKDFCSQKCLETLYHVCAHCNKPKPSGFFNGDIFLCDACNALPRCYSCNMPYGSSCKTLEDGRILCGKCAKTNIFSLKQATDIMIDVREILHRKFRFRTDHVITFDLCKTTDIARELGQASTDRERGLYLHSIKEVKLFNMTLNVENKYQIFILSGLPENLLRCVAAHEFTHDWMGEYLPHIKDLKVREGFAEFVAWKYAQSMGDTESMKNIEDNLDEIYGGGFREMKKLLKNAPDTASGWKVALLKKYPAPKSGK